MLDFDNLTFTCFDGDSDLVALLEGCVHTRNRYQTQANEQGMRHAYGLESLSGRDIHIDVRRPDGKEISLGVLVKMDYNGMSRYAELALSPGKIFQSNMRMENFLHTFQVDLSQIQVSKNTALFLCDLVSAISELRVNGLVAGSKGKKQTMKKYIQALVHIARENNISFGALQSIFRHYLRDKLSMNEDFYDQNLNSSLEKFWQAGLSRVG